MGKECRTCHEENDNIATVCSNCNIPLDINECENISVEESIYNPILFLKDMDSTFEKIIRINGNCIIGRKGDIERDYFAENLYISEYHCKIHLENGSYLVECLPTAKNITALDGITLGGRMRHKIRNGQYLKIANKTFEISIESEGNQLSNIDELSNDAIEKTERVAIYFIVCPKCGKEHLVSDLSERINECDRCDEYDRDTIAKVGARIRYADR